VLPGVHKVAVLWHIRSFPRGLLSHSVGSAVCVGELDWSSAICTGSASQWQ
jgi:hypothetical protein